MQIYKRPFLLQVGRLALCLLILFAAAAQTGAAFEKRGGIDPIASVPSFDKSRSDVNEAVEAYFDFTGPLVSEYPGRIVIGDRSFDLAEDVEKSEVQVGDYIGVKFDKSRRVIRIERLQPPEKRYRGGD